MNYRKIYADLIDRAKSRPSVEGYFEKHHIIPKCMMGSDDGDNLVALTAREHFVAHMLLVKIYPGHSGLVRAVVMMTAGENRMNNRVYEWIRVRFSKVQSDSQSGEKNTQFDTKWVYCDDFGPKKVPAASIPEYISRGWILGRTPKKIKRNKIEEKYKKNEKLREQLSEWLKIYETVGFDEFCAITGYTKSKANLVQRFSKHLSHFTPQNGKRRGAKFIAGIQVDRSVS